MKVKIYELEEHCIVCPANFFIDKDDVLQYDRMSDFGKIELHHPMVNGGDFLVIDDAMTGDQTIDVLSKCACGMMYTYNQPVCGNCKGKTVKCK